MCYYKSTVCAGAVTGNCKTVKMPRVAADGRMVPSPCNKYDGNKHCKKKGTVTMMGFNVYEADHAHKTRIVLCSKCTDDDNARELYGRVKGKWYEKHAAHTVAALRDALKGRST